MLSHCVDTHTSSIRFDALVAHSRAREPEDRLVHECGGDMSVSGSPAGSWRPRGALARALMDRMKNDEYLDSLDQSKWYSVESSGLRTSTRALFHGSSPDGATARWLAGARTTAANLPLQIYHAIARLVLGLFMTQTDVNGWLHRGSMFVLSTTQLSSLLTAAGYYPKINQKTNNNTLQQTTYENSSKQNDATNIDINEINIDYASAVNGLEGFDSLFPSKGKLLDIGAGDGDITARMEPLFEDVSVTEVSGTMRTRLAQRGYRVLEVDSWKEHGPYDVIACLNLLDRCSNPRTLLGDVRASLTQNGVVLVALVLPFKPYVERGTRDHRPFEFLEIHGSSFEEQVESTLDVFRELGFDIRAWSRVPYLCNGDLNQAYYHLDDLIVVMSKSEKKL